MNPLLAFKLHVEEKRLVLQDLDVAGRSGLVALLVSVGENEP
jgi:hypothetical protein